MAEVASDGIVEPNLPGRRELKDAHTREHLGHRIHLEARPRSIPHASRQLRETVTLEQYDLVASDDQDRSSEPVRFVGREQGVQPPAERPSHMPGFEGVRATSA